jgi:hypothetical protein
MVLNRVGHIALFDTAPPATMAADISGIWLGTYWQRGNPTRFEVTFAQGGNSISGRVMDDSPLGEANLSGTIAGRRLTFVKRYLASSQSPIEYTGIVSEDANYMSGEWRIGLFDSGSWEAHRSEDDLAKELKSIVVKETQMAGTATLP